MDNRVVGIFDSGLGGLTCVKEVMNILPDEKIVYFGDTGRVPYGTRSPQTIIKYVESDIKFLRTFDIKMIIIACGTASSVALETVQNKNSLPIMGVLIPAVEAAMRVTRGRIGVIGTPGTIHSGKYESEIKNINSEAFVISQACPLFVPLVENGYFKHEATYLIAKEYLKPLKEANVDTIIMGCTHYPLLKDTIYDIMDGKVNLIDPGYEASLSLKKYLEDNDMLAQCDDCANHRFYVSDSVEGFEKMGSMFLHKEIKGLIEKIDIEKY